MHLRTPVKQQTDIADSDRQTTPVDDAVAVTPHDESRRSPPAAHHRSFPKSASYSGLSYHDEPPRRRRDEPRNRLCRSFLATGTCAFGNRCHFIHPFPDEQVPPPPSYEAFIHEDPMAPISPLYPPTPSSFGCFPSYYRHEPYSVDAFVYFDDDACVMSC